MSVEQRIRYLEIAASRAANDGDVRLAELLARMAEEARPAETGPTPVL